MTKISISVIAVMLFIGSLLFFFSEKNEDRQSLTLPVSELSPSQVKSMAIETAPSLAAPALSSIVKLGQDYSTSRNARLFVGYAKQRPDLGGYTFAAQILADCDIEGINRYRELRYLPKESQADFTKRREVAQFWYQRCQGLLDSEANILATDVLDKEALKNNDVLAVISARINKALASKNRAEVRAALQQLFATKSSMIMQDVLYSVARAEAAFYNDQGKYDTGMWFEGKVHLEGDEQIYYFALDLLSCSFGNICDQYDSYVARACYSGAGCYPDRFAYIRNVTMARMFAKNPEAAEKTYQSLLTMHQRLVSAIERGDVDAFMRP